MVWQTVLMFQSIYEVLVCCKWMSLLICSIFVSAADTDAKIQNCMLMAAAWSQQHCDDC